MDRKDLSRVRGWSFDSPGSSRSVTTNAIACPERGGAESKGGSKSRWSVVITLAISAATMLSAQQPPSPRQAQPTPQAPQPPSQKTQQAQQGQTPTFRSGVELVTVDVGVVDRQGQPMRGLTASDFTVMVAGQP